MSLYSTPLWNMPDEETSSSNESSLYLTPPETCLTCNTSQHKSYNQSKPHFDFFNADVEIRPESSITTPPFTESSSTKRPTSLDIEKIENRTPKRNLFNVTPKTFKSSPLKCISNIVTPIEMKPCIIKFDDRLSKSKENKSPVSSSCELCLIDGGDSNSQISRLSNKASCSKTKSSILPWLGIRRKCKTELLSSGRRITSKSRESYATTNEIDRVNLPTTKYNTISLERIAKESGYSTNERLSESSSQDIKSIYDSRTSLLSRKEIPIKPKAKRLWNYVKLCRNSIKKISLSPVKRLLSHCRVRVSVKPFNLLFRRNHLKLINNDESDKLSAVESCKCSIVASRQEEYLLQIISRLTSLEEQIKEIKTSMKNSTNVASSHVLAPPPPPPLPPPLPPMLSNLSTIEGCKRKVDTTTPKSEQLLRRPSHPAERKTQFSITVDDIKSVKLRKTPSFMKSKMAIGSNSPSKSGRDTGVVRSVRFKPSKVRASDRKELSQLVAEILSPSKKNVIEKENLMKKRCRESNDENVAPNAFETTPVSTADISTKIKSIRRKNLLVESPTRK